MNTWKRIGVGASHGGVLGSNMRCTKAHQSAPESTKMVTIARESKVFRICPEWLLWYISGLNGHLKGDRSQNKSGRSHVVVHELHKFAPFALALTSFPIKFPFNPEMDHISHSGQIQNTLLCHTMVTIFVYIGPFWSTSCATPWPLHDLYWLLSSFKCPFHPKMNDISHSGQIRNTFLCQTVVTILAHFGPFWCTSCATPWPLHDLYSLQTPILFQVSV